MKAQSPLTKLEELEAKALIAFEQRRHKEAIIFYKDLLKQERRPQWEQALAEAYLRRAGQVAAKGMWQEAAILWENHAKLCPQTLPSEEYLGWLAQAGQFPKLAQRLADSAPAFEQGPLGRRLPETLAVLALQNEKLLVAFPLDHPIPKHHRLVKQALRAYAASRDEEAEEALRQIPSRSPYRNVRTLLKALLLMGQDRAAGLELLGRIEVDSACHGLAQQLTRQCQPGGPDLSVTSELAPKQQTLIGKLNGYGKAQLNLLKDAKKFGPDSNPRQVFNAVLNHRESFGESTCRRVGFSLLVGFPEGMDVFQKAFGKLSAFERHRLFALHEESQQYYAEAANHWEAAIDELAKQPERGRLDGALIFRHIAELAQNIVPPIAIDALEKSLGLDPDDQPTYRLLIRLCEETDADKEAQEWLDKGLKRFPKDVELLTLAMQVASKRKAFKKAAGFAKTLLDIDPINSAARQFLLDAHLGHARKQARAGKDALAAQELQQARALDPRRRNAALCLLDGLLSLRQQDKEHARELLAEGWSLAGGGLSAQFQANIEALNLDVTLKALTGALPGLAKTHQASRAELTSLATVLGQYAGEDKKRLAEAVKPLKPILKKAFKRPDLTEEDYFLLCQSFAKASQFDCLDECATEALRRFPGTASPLYFQIYADCKGEAKRLSDYGENRLATALDRARHANDHRTAALIEQMFRQLDEALEEDYFDEDYLPGIENLQRNLTPDLERRIMELDSKPHAELLAMVSKALPDLPLQSLPHRDLLNIAQMMLMGELGLDLNALFGDLVPPGLLQKPKKSR